MICGTLLLIVVVTMESGLVVASPGVSKVRVCVKQCYALDESP